MLEVISVELEVFLGELFFVLVIDADHHEIRVLAESLVEGEERLMLQLAFLTPGGPEVKHHDLSLELAQRNGPPLVELRGGDGGGGRLNDDRGDIRRIAVETLVEDEDQS